jgi:hypothetical protein
MAMTNDEHGVHIGCSENTQIYIHTISQTVLRTMFVTWNQDLFIIAQCISSLAMVYYIQPIQRYHSNGSFHNMTLVIKAGIVKTASQRRKSNK